MEYRILGPLEVLGEDGPAPLPEGRARALLAILILHPGQVVSTDQLIDQLWGAQPPATARTKLYGLVSRLRRTLEPHRERQEEPSTIRTRSPGYVLVADPEQIDALAFRRLVERARDLAPTEKAPLLRRALDLWRGPALADFTYEQFAQVEIASLEELRLAAIEELIAAELDLGHHLTLISELEGLVSENPFRERLRAQLMLALYRSGSQRKALRVYRDAYNILTEELGIEPGPMLEEMEQAILIHDPALIPKAVVGYEDETATSPGDVLSEPWLTEARKTVTVVFVDLTIGEVADPETHRRQIRPAQRSIAETLHSHGGMVQGSMGGVTVAVFGLPVAHEDDPLRAVRAAATIVESLSSLPDDSGRAALVRIGINTGEVVTGVIDSGADLAGDAVRLAASLQQSAEPGEILIGDETRRLLADAAEVQPVDDRVVDSARPQLTAWRLFRADPSLGPSVPQSTAPLVGRDEELEYLLAVFRQTADSGTPKRIRIVGMAGIGKSRLAREFAASIGNTARVLTGHCPPYGEGATFWPLREIVARAAGRVSGEAVRSLLATIGADEAVAGTVAGAIGSTASAVQADDLFPALREFFEGMARDRPLVVIVEDAHWAQRTFLELLEYLTVSVSGPLLLLILARPESLETSYSAARGEGTETLTLQPLGQEQAERLVRHRLPASNVAYRRAEQAIEIAEGNPLFLEQILAALQDSDELMVPPSIQALLVARLDRLGPAERDVIRAASVLGRRFEMEDLIALLPERARGSAVGHVSSLVGRELMDRADAGAFTFRHGLVQLVAYRTLTKDSRAMLHERVADVLDRRTDEESTQMDEIVGYHLEQAFQYRDETYPEADHNHLLASRAGSRLFRAGMRAFGRFDAAGAENLLTRAERLLPEDHPDLWTVKRYRAETYQVMGNHEKADRVLSELVHEAESGEDRALESFLRLERAWARIAMGPDPISLGSIEREAQSARQVFEEAGDETGLAQVARVMVHVHYRRGHMTAMEEAAYQGLDHAGRSDSSREQLGAQWMVAIALEEGPRPVEECIERCNEVVDWRDTENPGVVSTLGYLWAMRREVDKARQLTDKARRILRERIRARRPLAQVTRRAGDIELLAGDPLAGEKRLQEALELNAEMGENDMISQIAATLSRALARRGETDRAERMAAMSEKHAPRESLASQALWRSVRARILSLRERHEEAVFLADQAVGLVPLEMLNLRAEVCVDRSAVLQRAGHHDRAAQVMHEAVDLFERKGNLVSGEKWEP